MVWYDNIMKKWIVLIILIMMSGCFNKANPSFTSKSITLSNSSIIKDATLSRCVDGDTAHLVVNREILKVRFLSIDTPEINHENPLLSQPFGELAAEFTCNMLKSATTIIIETDPYEDSVDRFGRVLAWVWVDKVLLNAQLVELGYAQVAFVETVNLHSKDLEKLEIQSQKAQRGIWKP